ncbi:type II secretion system protein GspL [Orrella sp. JC864]|uniref:type II secretion system protein GspL n=1 Tax=Orrella sp. JC864 TaxID=3120298 RepID=UPI00300B153D
MKPAGLRLALPRLDRLQPDAVAAYAVLAGGQWQPGQASLAEIARRYGMLRAEAVLHPESCALVAVSMPPLPEKRRRAAVTGEVEALALGPVESLALAYGPRQADGAVPLAWLPQQALQTAMAQLRAIGLRLQALYPAPFFLPVQGPAPAMIQVDGWQMVRTGTASGLVLPPGAPLPAEAAAAAMPPPALCWSGPAPGWSLPVPGAHAGRPAARWGLAAALLAGAMLAWLGGLSLQAARLATHGKALQDHMRARVQDVFPELPIVVNPLQQARQQREARLAGASEEAGEPDFARMLRAASASLDGLQGQVQTLRYQDGVLFIGLRGGPPPSESQAAAVAERAQAAGLSIAPHAGGWQVHARQESLAARPAAGQGNGASRTGR